jgi:hypothetical protein
MSFSKEERERLKTILKQAYLEKEDIVVDDLRADDLMRRIRGLGTIQAAPRFHDIFGQLVWRLAPVACFLMIILAAILVNLDFLSEYNVFQLLMNETKEVTLVSLGF